MFKKRGQVTVFIIIAIVIVAAIAAFFILRSTITTSAVPASLEPVYASFLACLEDDTVTGITVLESQGGYIELPEFKPGSQYMPFSSQLNFLGNPIPYWYYVSGNNIQKEQVPTLSDMEEQLGDFIENRINNCLLDSYLENGYGVSMGEEVEADVKINEENVEINLDMALAMERANDSVVVNSHNIAVNSRLGKLYSDARAIYDYEQESLFLENYGVDTLRLYAPVDGVEISCSPKVWSADEVFDELGMAIEENTLALKVNGGNFELQNPEDKYFVIDVPVEENVLFLNSRNWSHSFEVNPSQESIMIAKPVGNQPGMGMLGFCYIPYHFVYNVNYPVLVQVYSGSEIFQFPLAVVIQGNKPREALDTSAIETPEIDLCDYKNTQVTVNVFDTSLNPLDANISFKCFGEICQIGQTEDGVLSELFPQCVNGFVIAKSDGYKTVNEPVPTTVQSNGVIVILEKMYNKNVNLKLDGRDYNEEAIISFVSDDDSKTLIYPGQKQVNLSQGQYEVQVYIYRNSSIKLQETTQEQCTEVPKEGLGALFGLTEEKCFDVTIPSQTISSALVGGGNQNYYIAESELIDFTTIDINADSLATPRTLEDLQKNYIEFEDKGLDINFK